MSGILDQILKTAYLNGDEATRQLIRSKFGLRNINHPSSLNPTQKVKTEMQMIKNSQPKNTEDGSIISNMR